jgi:predicted lactoylglutathione lyase
MSCEHMMIAVLPCNDVDTSEAFYAKLGFVREAAYNDYRVLLDGKGAELHLTAAPEGWLVPGRNCFGLYLFVENVNELAQSLSEHVLQKPAIKSWGMYEFALADPDGTLVKVGWPAELAAPKEVAL